MTGGGDEHGCYFSGSLHCVRDDGWRVDGKLIANSIYALKRQSFPRHCERPKVARQPRRNKAGDRSILSVWIASARCASQGRDEGIVPVWIATLFSAPPLPSLRATFGRAAAQKETKRVIARSCLSGLLRRVAPRKDGWGGLCVSGLPRTLTDARKDG